LHRMPALPRIGWRARCAVRRVRMLFASEGRADYRGLPRRKMARTKTNLSDSARASQLARRVGDPLCSRERVFPNRQTPRHDGNLLLLRCAFQVLQCFPSVVVDLLSDQSGQPSFLRPRHPQKSQLRRVEADSVFSNGVKVFACQDHAIHFHPPRTLASEMSLTGRSEPRNVLP